MKNHRDLINIDKSSLKHFFVPTTYAAGMTHPASYPHEEYLSVRNAITDDDAIQALNTLIIGPVESWDIIEKAEMALRSFILHDRVDCIFPAVLVTYDFAQNTQPVYEHPKWPHALVDLTHHVNMFHRFVFNSWISIRNKKQFNEISRWAGHKNDVIDGQYFGHLHKNIPKVVEPYLQSVRLYESLVATPTILGAATYFTNNLYTAIENKKVRKANPQEWLKQIDKDWEANLLRLSAIGFNLKLGPFLSIVLSRASNRENIPLAIIEFREEMKSPRAQLWGMLQELQFDDLQQQLHKADKILKSAQSIIPSAFPQKMNFLRIGWDAIKNLKLLTAIKEIADLLVLKGTIRNQLHTVDAARLLRDELRQIDGFAKLIEKHLTHTEFQNLWIT